MGPWRAPIRTLDSPGWIFSVRPSEARRPWSPGLGASWALGTGVEAGERRSHGSSRNAANAPEIYYTTKPSNGHWFLRTALDRHGGFGGPVAIPGYSRAIWEET